MNVNVAGRLVGGFCVFIAAVAGIALLLPGQWNTLLDKIAFGEIGFGSTWHATSLFAVAGLFGFAAWRKRNLLYAALCVPAVIMLHEPFWLVSTYPYLQLYGAPPASYDWGTWQPLIIGGVVFLYLFIRVFGHQVRWDYKRMFYAWLPFAVALLAWHLSPGGYHFSIPTVAGWRWNNDLAANLWESGTWALSCVSFAVQVWLDPAPRVPLSRFENYYGRKPGWRSWF